MLAAGGGTRLRSEVGKPLVPFLGRALIDWATTALAQSGLDPLLVVVGHDGATVGDRVPDGFRVLENSNWSEGIASSLRVALEALRTEPAVCGAVVGLVDQPLVGAEAYRRVAAAYDSGAQLAAAVYAGRRANPVLLGRVHWDEAAGLDGDVGARQLMARHPVTEVPCDGAGDPTDIDTFDDLVALEARWR